MEHESDEVKFEHHKRLIQITVGAAFAGCNLVEKSVDAGVAFRARDFGIGAMYSLEVARPVLVDSRADGEIEEALTQAIRLMQENPVGRPLPALSQADANGFEPDAQLVQDDHNPRLAPSTFFEPEGNGSAS